MGTVPNLRGIDKVEMVNWGLSPDLDRNNHGKYYPKKAWEHVQSGGKVVAFQGIKIEDIDKGYEFSVREPMLMSISENIFYISSFNPEGDPNRFRFNLDKRIFRRADEKGIYLRGENERYPAIISPLYSYSKEDSPQLALPNKIITSEMHKKYLRCFAEAHGLEFGDYSEGKRDGRGDEYVQTFSHKDGLVIDLGVLRRRSRENRQHWGEDVRLSVISGGESIKNLEKFAGNHSYPFLSKGRNGVFEFGSTPYQTGILEDAMGALLGKKE